MQQVYGALVLITNAKLQHRAMRTFMGVAKVTPIPFLYGEMNWLAPQIRHKIELVRLWLRLIDMDSSRITKKIFDWDYQIAENGNVGWNSNVKTVFTTAGMEASATATGTS